MHLVSADLRVRSHFAKAFFLADSLPPTEVEAKRSSLQLGSADLGVRSPFAMLLFLAESLPPAELEESVSCRRRMSTSKKVVVAFMTS